MSQTPVDSATAISDLQNNLKLLIQASKTALLAPRLRKKLEDEIRKIIRVCSTTLKRWYI